MELPVYCEFYKWFLVEEVILSFPQKYHYGRCSVLGRLNIGPPDTGIFINNSKIPSIDRNYQLDSGDLTLRTIWTICQEVPAYGVPVEVYGEAVLRNKSKKDRDPENVLAMTIRDVIRDLRSHSGHVEDFWQIISEQYEPALKVHSYRPVTQIDRLIECNLRLRICSQITARSQP